VSARRVAAAEVAPSRCTLLPARGGEIVPAIRLAVEADAVAIADVYRPIVESTTISFETSAPDEVEMRRRLAETLPAYPWLVYDIDGHLAGYAYAGRHRARAAYQWSVDTSIYIDAAHRRSGLGRGLYTSLFAILTAQGFFGAYAGITLPNTASVALHERVGFTAVGVYRNVGYKCGAWHDVGWWQMPLRPLREPEAAPLTIAALQARGDWEQLLSAGMAKIGGA
jgi:phosphinothricin acetyltransferase